MKKKQVGAITLYFPKELAESASLVLNVFLDIIPVVESYFETSLEGSIHLEISTKTYKKPTKPSEGIIRYALINNPEVRSPVLAGQLCYELGKILWYRGSSDFNYTGLPPRTPLWLQEAALLPLKYLWLEQEKWLQIFRENLRLCQSTTLLNIKQLNKTPNLSIKDKSLAEAQCLLRGYSIDQRYPKWCSQLSRILSIDFNLNGEAGLIRITNTDLKTWEETFLTDLNLWLKTRNLDIKK